MTASANRFLRELTTRFTALGHSPAVDWRKGRWGFHTWCSECGAHASCCVSDKRVREFPEDTCAERKQKVSNYRHHCISPDEDQANGKLLSLAPAMAALLRELIYSANGHELPIPLALKLQEAKQFFKDLEG